MTTYLLVAVYLTTPLLIAWGHGRYRIVRTIGSVIIAYAIGVVLSLTGVMQLPTIDADRMNNIQSLLTNVSVPLAIPLMLFNCDFRLWARSLPKTLYALTGGIVASVVAILTTYTIFRHFHIIENESLATVAGLLTGIYTGGTMNFNALGMALKVNPTTLVTLLTIEMFVTFPLVVFVVGGGYRLFRRILPYADQTAPPTPTSDTDGTPVTDIENYTGLFSRHTIGNTLIGLLLSCLILVMAVGLSMLLTGKINEMVVILTITTLAIAASFSPRVRSLPNTFPLGMLLILLFSIVVASQFNLQSLTASVAPLCLFILTVLTIAITVHILLCRLMKVPGDLFTVSLIGLTCSPPFVPPVVAAMKNTRVLISGIAVGLVGYAIGTYLGFAITWLLTAIG
mgnify:CR=1 FL=1